MHAEGVLFPHVVASGLLPSTQVLPDPPTASVPRRMPDGGSGEVLLPQSRAGGFCKTQSRRTEGALVVKESPI